MPATREQLIEAGKKARLSPDTGKRGKAKKTISREEARLFYELQVLKDLGEITDIQIAAAKKVQNREERMFVINQIIGKAKETHDVNIGGRIVFSDKDRKKVLDIFHDESNGEKTEATSVNDAGGKKDSD